MKIAVFHDFLETMGGGERVALVLARYFRADLITTGADGDLAERAGYGDVNVIRLGPLRRRPPFKQIDATRKFAAAKFRGYDAHIVLGNWAVYAAPHHRPNLYYCLTPNRMFFDRREAILRRLGPGTRLLARPWIRAHRALDRRAVKQCDRIVAISKTVQRRIRDAYGREAPIVYPPVDTARYRYEEVGDTWLAVNRLYPEKRIDLLLDIFRRLPNEKLVLVGGYSPGDWTERYVAGLRPPANVTMLGQIPEDALLRLYATCRGLITAAADEDFGLTPVEAMASGKCVLATDEGGYRETVVPGKTGFLLPPDAAAFAAAIRALDGPGLHAMREACMARARLFDESVFLEAMRSFLPDSSAGGTGGSA